MSFDVQLINSRGTSMFLSTASTMQLFARGTAAIEVGDREVYVNTGIAVGTEREFPLLLFDELNSLKSYTTGLFELAGSWWFRARRSDNNKNSEMLINWFVYDTLKGIAAPSGYGIHIYRDDGSLSWSSEIETLRSIASGAILRGNFPRLFAYDGELPTRYLESRHVHSTRLDISTSGTFTSTATRHYTVRYNGSMVNPSFELDSFNAGVSTTNDGGAGGTSGTFDLYGDKIPVMLFHHPDSA